MPPACILLQLAILASMAADTCAADRVQPNELLSNGTMESGKDGKPVGWGGRWEMDAANPFLRLAGGPGRAAATRELPIAGQRALRLSWRVRHADVEHDATGGRRASIGIDLLDAAGREVLPGPSYPTYSGTSAGWMKGSVVFFVPQAAVAVRFMPMLDGQRGGTLDIDQLTLEVVNPADVPAETRTTGRVPVDGGKPQPPALRAERGRLLADGRDVWLQGLALEALDTASEDQAIARLATAIEVWKANIVRLPVIRERWLSEDDDGAAYRSTVADLVRAAGTRGAWIVVDLQRTRAPDELDIRFWKDAASRLKGQPAAVLGLFNAPQDLDWKSWRSGGGPDGGAGAAVRSVGMQALLDAVRAAGNRNAVLVGGIRSSGGPPEQGMRLDDRGGNGVIWDVHADPSSDAWTRVLGQEGGMPVIAGLVEGAIDAPAGGAADRHADAWTWVPGSIGRLQSSRLGWIAGTFSSSGRSPLLQDPEGAAPTPAWGAFVRAALLGHTFAPLRD